MWKQLRYDDPDRLFSSETSRPILRTIPPVLIIMHLIMSMVLNYHYLRLYTKIAKRRRYRNDEVRLY